jgi:hypothetical protein
MSYLASTTVTVTDALELEPEPVHVIVIVCVPSELGVKDSDPDVDLFPPSQLALAEQLEAFDELQVSVIELPSSIV